MYELARVSWPMRKRQDINLSLSARLDPETAVFIGRYYLSRCCIHVAVVDDGRFSL